MKDEIGWHFIDNAYTANAFFFMLANMLGHTNILVHHKNFIGNISIITVWMQNIFWYNIVNLND